MDLTFDCEEIGSVTYRNGKLTVAVTDVNIDDILSDVLDDLDASDVLKHMDNDHFLEEIGVEDAKAFFDLVETEQ